MTINNRQEFGSFKKSVLTPLLFVVLIINIQIIQWAFSLSLVFLGVLPRNLTGLKGILFAPLIHAGFYHVLSNSVPLFILGTAVKYFYPRASDKVFVFIYFLPNILVWLFARQAYHIGSSGIVYGLGSFLFFSGVFRKDKTSIAVALIVVFLYGGLVWGIFPIKRDISFESHFFGMLIGALIAFLFKDYDRKPVEKDGEDWDRRKLKISYFNNENEDDFFND